MNEKLKDLAAKAKNYKKQIAGRFMPVEPDFLKKRLSGETYAVTRKIDGLMQLLMFEDGKAYAAGSTGVIRDDLPCLEEFAAVLSGKGIKSALVAAELYVPAPDNRPRCYDVNSALGENGDISKCRLAPFDLLELDKKKPVIVCGDLNVAHQEIDLKNPKTNRKNAGFTDEEREKFSILLDSGFIDTFRHFYPDVEGIYSWWSYRFQARAKNAGWRIDYFLVSECLKDTLKGAHIHTDILGSDHCPVECTLDI